MDDKLPGMNKVEFSLTIDVHLPAVTCLCPTYGRFSLLRESLACFHAQDYPNKMLLILNDAEIPIERAEYETMCKVVIWNCPGRFANLGEKRQALLELATTPLVAHWDDDDFYLPWHLSRSVKALLMRPAMRCVKSRGAWYMVGKVPDIQCRGIHHNVFEGSMVFFRKDALELGGYPPLHSGQAKALMDRFEKTGQLYKIPDNYGCPPSYVYRWGQGVGHVSAYKNKSDSLARFRAENQDFGKGQILTPADLAPYWAALTENARQDLPQEEFRSFEEKLEVLTT